MKAWLLDKLEGIEKLRLAEVADPVAATGEAVVVIAFAALNPADSYLAKGEYPCKTSFPHVLGRDAIGTVESIGHGVTKYQQGDRVIVLRSDIGVNRAGSFAEKVAVPVASLAPAPQDFTDKEAAGAALVYLTAQQAITQWGELKTSVILITGASGGVGVAAVQLASAAGHTVVALSRSDDKRRQLIELGAALCFDPTDASWTRQLKESLGNRRIDLAIDNIGGPGFAEVISVLGHGGRVSVVGRLAGPVPQFNTSTLLFRRIKIGGVSVGDYTPAESQVAWSSALQTLNRADAKPLVDSVYPFEKLLDAFAKLEKGPMGKVLLRVAG